MLWDLLKIRTGKPFPLVTVFRPLRPLEMPEVFLKKKGRAGCHATWTCNSLGNTQWIELCIEIREWTTAVHLSTGNGQVRIRGAGRRLGTNPCSARTVRVTRCDYVIIEKPFSVPSSGPCFAFNDRQLRLIPVLRWPLGSRAPQEF